MGCHFPLQGIFPAQGSNLGLPCLFHYRQILCLLSPWEELYYKKLQQVVISDHRYGGVKTTDIHPPPALETRHLRSRGPRAGLSAEAPGEGPPRLFQLQGATGVRPWAGGRLPPVSASVSTWLLLCVRVSPLLCLIRTLALGLRPSPSRRASSQTFTPPHL